MLVTASTSEWQTYTAVRATKTWLKSFMVNVLELRAYSGSRKLENVAAVSGSAEVLMVANVKLSSVQDAKLGCPQLSSQAHGLSQR